MDISGTTMVAIAELRRTAAQPGTLEEKLRATMKEAKHHWLVTNEEERFKAAVGAVLLEVGEEERARIGAEMRLLGTVSAAISGVPVDYGSAIPANFEPVGLMGMWREEE